MEQKIRRKKIHSHTKNKNTWTGTFFATCCTLLTSHQNKKLHMHPRYTSSLSQCGCLKALWYANAMSGRMHISNTWNIFREGKKLHTSNIDSINIFSNIARKPRAPVFLDIAFLAINLKAFSVKCSLTWDE